jgi:pimeloyl-ACP methyl ester carboxylesterase
MRAIADGLDEQKIHYVDVDGVRTRYYEDGEGETLVLLHGGEYGSLYSLDGWSLVLSELSASFRVIALDRLGNGHTGNPSDRDGYTLDALFRHTLGFFQALDIRSAHVAGHSRGGFLGTWLALEHSHLVRSLVIVDSRTTAPASTQHPNDVFYEALGHRPKLLEGSPTLDLIRVEPEAQAIVKEHITEDFLARMLEIARLPKTLEAQRRLRAIREDSWLPAIYAKRVEMLEAIEARGLPVPTMLLWGFDDRSAPFPTAVDLFTRIAAKTPEAELHVINRAGHYVFRDQPTAFARALTGYYLHRHQLTAP